MITEISSRHGKHYGWPQREAADEDVLFGLYNKGAVCLVWYLGVHGGEGRCGLIRFHFPSVYRGVCVVKVWVFSKCSLLSVDV
jgi:hypothetical protein